MSLSNIRSKQPVLKAIDEFKRLGRDQFLEKYGFDRARSYFLVHEGQKYDSKAIIGVAHGYARPKLGPLKANEFSGGEATVERKLKQLGFRTIRQETTRGHGKMIETIRRILELQPLYSHIHTPEMQERQRLVRTKLVQEIRALSEPLSNALGTFGSDFHVSASDGMGSKTELPWVRFCSKRMAPRPTKGFYCVLHFSTDGSAVHITLGCNSSEMRKGSLVPLPDEQIAKRTAWARGVIKGAAGSLNPFIDQPDFGARRALPKSFERATAASKRIAIDKLHGLEIEHLLVQAAEFLRLIYEAERDDWMWSPADFDATDIREPINLSKDFVEEVEPEFVEGRVLTEMHRKRERDSNLRKQVLKRRRESGALRCDSCSLSFPHLDEPLNSAALEVHHLVPLAAQAGRRIVRIAETALLCATCHRLIHALFSQRKEWVSLESLKSTILRL